MSTAETSVVRVDDDTYGDLLDAERLVQSLFSMADLERGCFQSKKPPGGVFYRIWTNITVESRLRFEYRPTVPHLCK